MDEAAFIAKLSDWMVEAAETQTWIAFAIQCNYLDQPLGSQLSQTYDRIIGILVNLTHTAKTWTLTHPRSPPATIAGDGRT